MKMWWGGMEGKDKVYTWDGKPILHDGEKIIDLHILSFRIVQKTDCMDAGWGNVYRTEKRLFGIRDPDPWELTKRYHSKKSRGLAIERLYASMGVLIERGCEFFELNLDEIWDCKKKIFFDTIDIIVKKSKDDVTTHLLLKPRSWATKILGDFLNHDWPGRKRARNI